MGNSRNNKNNLKSWTELLTESRESMLEAPGPEWKTTSQVAEETGVSASHASQKLRVALRDGEVEMKKFLIDTGSKPYPVPHYRIIK